jgi:AcrR family transcriptional regulator
MLGKSIGAGVHTNWPPRIPHGNQDKEIFSMERTDKSLDPRVKRTRKLLQQAFLELFQEKGFSAISIQDITDRATVNRATFYAHFADKYALLDALIREQFQEAMTSKLPASPKWGVQSLRLLIRAVLDYLDEFQSHCKPTDRQFDPLWQRAIQRELAEILLSWLKQAKTSGVKPRVDIETMASVMSWAIFGTAAEWSGNEGTISAEEMTMQVLLILTEGGAHLAPVLSD